MNAPLFFLWLFSLPLYGLLCNFYAPLFLLCHHLILWGKVLILFNFNLFSQLLVEVTAHSRSSAMPVRCVNMNLSRIRLVGAGPGVESGESNLVYLWMPLSKMLGSLNLSLRIMKMCLTIDVPTSSQNYCEDQMSKQVQKNTWGDGKKLHKVVFWNQKVTKAHHGSSLGKGQTRGLDSSLPSEALFQWHKE